MKKLKILLSSLFVFVLAGGLYAVTWDMPLAYPDSNYHTQTARAFVEAVDVATGGKLKINIHSNGSLFKGNEIKRAVQRGQAQIGERLLSAHANENPLFELDTLPFLATSFAESAKLWGIAREKYEKTLEKQGLILLYSIPWPPQGLYAKKALNTIGDMKGLKLRSYNATISRIATMAKASPLQIEAAELSQALATGVADSFVSSGSTGYDIKAWESLSHFYAVNAWLPRNYVFVNKKAWDKLDIGTRNIVKAIAKVIERSGNIEAEKLTNWYLAQFVENGMEVLPPSQNLKSGLDKIGDVIVKDWLKKAGKEGREILNKFKN